MTFHSESERIVYCIDILSRWIDAASQYDLIQVKKHLWNLREILERKPVIEAQKKDAFEWLKKAKESEDKSILLRTFGIK